MDGAAVIDTGGGGPMAAYRALGQAGEIVRDPAQELAVEKLELLSHRLHGYQPATGHGLRRWLNLTRRAEPPQGLYLHGGVGRGKSFLMDLFFAHCHVEAKRRVHFHAFMQEVHGLLHRYRREENPGTHTRDAIPPIARRLSAEAWLLCFDELQVTDIADAMVLGRLFARLLENGVVIVATSNRPPDDLYKSGLNRDLFVPFIDLIKERLDILHLDGPTDYRTTFLTGVPVYLAPATADARAQLDRDFAHLVGGDAPAAVELGVQGRKVRIPRAARGVARATFADLCEHALGAADYLAIASAFHTLVLDGIPRLGGEDRNAARRFITLIDVLYEHRVKLLCTAAAPPAELYVEGDGSFEFARTVSRLMEMQSAEYLASAHRPGVASPASGP
jgi:cell division protein ZapE